MKPIGIDDVISGLGLGLIFAGILFNPAIIIIGVIILFTLPFF